MADAEYEALLGDLRALTDAPNGAEFTRSNLITLLGVLVTYLGDALATEVGELEDGTPIGAEHPVSAQLSGLVEALRDLDIGLTDPVLCHASSKKMASRKWRERQEDVDIILGLKALRQARGIKKWTEVAALAKKLLNEKGHKYRNQRLDAKILTSLLHRRG